MRELDKRFWGKVNVSSDAFSCWNWMGARNKSGYGLFNVADSRSGRKCALANRVSYMMKRGHIPHGYCVLHTCDNPSCVNPRHLFLGTMADNNSDMRDKGRSSPPPHYFGSKNPASKLTELQAIEIWHAAGKQRDIAKMYGVSQHAVWQIKARRKWQHITGAMP